MGAYSVGVVVRLLWNGMDPGSIHCLVGFQWRPCTMLCCTIRGELVVVAKSRLMDGHERCANGADSDPESQYTS